MTCPRPHPIRGPGGVGFAPNVEMLGSHAADAWARCRLCGAMFWAVDDDGKYMYSNQWELDPGLAREALVLHDPHALARLFVSNDLPLGPLWDFAAALIEIFRALTPGSNDADRAAAIDAAGPHARWSKAARVLEAAARARKRAPVPQATFPVDVRATGRTFREWHEVGDALVLLTGMPEMLRLEPRGLTGLPLAQVPRYLAGSHDRLMLAVGDAGILVLDAAGQATSWPLPTAVTSVPIDGGWWLLVPQEGGEERMVELLEPNGQPHGKLKRRFASDARWMPSPRRVEPGWIVSNLVRASGGTLALTLLDADLRAIAASGAIPPAERDVLPIDDRSFWARLDGATERWVRNGEALERVETFPARSSWWHEGRLVTHTREGVVTARGPDGAIVWTWKRETSGATYGVPTPGGFLFHDNDHAHWLGFDGELRRTIDVESAHVHVTRGGTVYLKSLVDLWIIGRDDAQSVAVGTDAALETTCGESALLRSEDGTCLLISRAGVVATFTAKDAHFPVTGTRGGPWVVEGDRIRGAFAPQPG
jgi:hypothetical protein